MGTLQTTYSYCRETLPGFHDSRVDSQRRRPIPGSIRDYILPSPFLTAAKFPARKLPAKISRAFFPTDRESFPAVSQEASSCIANHARRGSIEPGALFLLVATSQLPPPPLQFVAPRPASAMSTFSAILLTSFMEFPMVEWTLWIWFDI